jgi:hypothetical protein
MICRILLIAPVALVFVLAMSEMTRQAIDRRDLDQRCAKSCKRAGRPIWLVSEQYGCLCFKYSDSVNVDVDVKGGRIGLQRPQPERHPTDRAETQAPFCLVVPRYTGGV